MSTVPELLIPAGTPEEASRYIDAGATAILIGEQKFGMRLPGEIKLEQMKQIVDHAHAKGAKVYVQVNNLMENEVLGDLPAYLEAITALSVDAAVFGDPSVLIVCRQHAPSLKLHWNTEMTSTNYATANYWAKKGASRVVLARELNLDQVVEVKRQVKIEVQVQVHGMTNIYHSKRSLVANYMKHQRKDAAKEETGMRRGMYLVEAERQDEQYPVYEDANGTHIMSSEDICMLDALEEFIEAGIDSLKIESLLKPASYNETVVRSYRNAIDAVVQGRLFQEEWLEDIRKLQDPDRELTYGFFYKEQVY